MRIGIDISQILFEGTGTATYFKNLIDWLPKIDRKNSYVFFGSSLRRTRVGFWRLPPTLLDLLWNRLHVLPIENLIGPIDIFHSSDWTQPPTRAKKVAPVLDMVIFKQPEFSHPKIIATQKRRLNWVKKEADRVITISQSAKNDIVEILGIPEEKIRVIYLAANVEFKPQPRARIDAVQKKYGLNTEYFLTMGKSGSRKNVEIVASAAKKINMRLAVIGNPGLGYVPQGDLPAIYAGARCFVYPSLYEGFGIPILEALSCNTPVICGRNSSMPEVGGDAVTYADVKNIDDLAEKMANAHRTGKELSQANKFSWEKMARETLKVYEELA